MELKKGVLIVLEGIDGSGKTTQARRLLESLKAESVDAVYFREPSGSRWGLAIKKKAKRPNSLTPEEELDLFQKDRRENVAKNLKPALQNNKVVILDRYYFSTIAYQGARGLDPRMIQENNEEFAVRPDLVFILDIDPEKGLKRIEKDGRKKDRLFEQKEYLAEVRKIFKRFKGNNISHLDAQRSPDEIFRKIKKIVFDYLAKLS
jgi:dTMP kinase